MRVKYYVARYHMECMITFHDMMQYDSDMHSKTAAEWMCHWKNFENTSVFDEINGY